MISMDRKKKLALLISELTGDKHKVIWEDSNGPKPKGKFISLKITPIGSDNPESQHQQDGTIKQIIRSTANMTMNFHRGDAILDASLFLSNIEKTSYNDYFFTAMCEDGFAVSVLRTLNIVDLTALNQTTYESRALLELELSMVHARIDNGVNDCGLGTKFPVNIKGEYISENEVVENITNIEISK